MPFRAQLERPIGSLSYAILIPQGEPPKGGWPLMLFLHDRDYCGTNPSALIESGPGLAFAEAPEQWPGIIFLPQIQSHTEWDGDNLERATQLLNRMIQAYRTNAKKTYLIGIGIGGHGAWHLAMRHPRSFSAVVPIGGGADPVQAVKILKNMPIWSFHGALDEQVPVSFSRAINDSFAQHLGRPFRYSEIPNQGSDTWTSVLKNAELSHWIFAQGKDHR